MNIERWKNNPWFRFFFCRCTVCGARWCPVYGAYRDERKSPGVEIMHAGWEK